MWGEKLLEWVWSSRSGVGWQSEGMSCVSDVVDEAESIVVVEWLALMAEGEVNVRPGSGLGGGEGMGGEGGCST